MAFVLDKTGESRLNLCLPNDTSSLEGVLLTPVGLLARVHNRPRGEYFTADGLLPFSDPPPLLVDLLIIFILLQTLNPPGEEEEEEDDREVR